MEIGHGHVNGMGVAQVSCPNERERLTEHAKSQTSQKIKKRKKKGLYSHAEPKHNQTNVLFAKYMQICF